MRVVKDPVERSGKKTAYLQGYDHAILSVLYDRSMCTPAVQTPKGVYVPDPYHLRVAYRVSLEFTVERIDLQYQSDGKSKWTTLYEREKNRIGKQQLGNRIDVYLYYLSTEEAEAICAELRRKEAIAAYRRLAKEG